VCNLDGGFASFGARIVAYGGACGALAEIQCALNYSVSYCGTTRTSFPLVPGQPVYLRLGGGYAGQNGYFTLTLQASPAPPNDTCANAIAVALGANGPFANDGASDGYSSISMCSYIGQQNWSPGYSDVWFSFTPACDGIVRFWLCSTSGFAARSSCTAVPAARSSLSAGAAEPAPAGVLPAIPGTELRSRRG
jgi:hypothetical protein